MPLSAENKLKIVGKYMKYFERNIVCLLFLNFAQLRIHAYRKHRAVGEDTWVRKK